MNCKQNRRVGWYTSRAGKELILASSRGKFEVHTTPNGMVLFSITTQEGFLYIYNLNELTHPIVLKMHVNSSAAWLDGSDGNTYLSVAAGDADRSLHIIKIFDTSARK